MGALCFTGLLGFFGLISVGVLLGIFLACGWVRTVLCTFCRLVVESDGCFFW